LRKRKRFFTGKRDTKANLLEDWGFNLTIFGEKESLLELSLKLSTRIAYVKNEERSSFSRAVNASPIDTIHNYLFSGRKPVISHKFHSILITFDICLHNYPRWG
jgi:hypothetical protein